jgi:L-ascorbate metabolism protein UlaG (beta-lactamase superfamily)
MKLKNILIPLLFLFASNVYSQDNVKTNKGDLTIRPILHGTVVFEWDKKTIFVDPYGGAEVFAGLAAPDIILITDIHGDHLNVETLKGLKTSNTKWIVPQAVADQLPENLAKDVTVIGNGEHIEMLGVPIEALPMYNLPESADSRHTKGRGNGYILNLGGKQIYLSGDTEDIAEMRALKNIDIAFVCMNLPYTMDINQAASAVLEFKPTVIYPYHYRGQGGLADVDAFKKLVNQDNAEIEVRLRKWYP